MRHITIWLSNGNIGLLGIELLSTNAAKKAAAGSNVGSSREPVEYLRCHRRPSATTPSSSCTEPYDIMQMHLVTQLKQQRKWWSHQSYPQSAGRTPTTYTHRLQRFVICSIAFLTTQNIRICFLLEILQPGRQAEREPAQEPRSLKTKSRSSYFNVIKLANYK